MCACIDKDKNCINLKPSATVLVATIRALKMHGGVDFENLKTENLEALERGFKNLEQHYQNLRKYDIPVIVAINHFKDDTENEIKLLEQLLAKNYYPYAFLDGFLNGGKGSQELATKVLEVLHTKKSNFHPIYNIEDSIENKIRTIAKEIYRADDVVFLPEAIEKIKEIKALKRDNLPICMAKTQSSFSDNPLLINAPRDFKITVRDLKLSNGAGFIVAYCGNILTMPGLPKIPQAVKMEDL